MSEKRVVKKFLEENFVSIIFDRAIARMTADIRVTQKVKLPDAAIAATAIFTNSALITRNIKDFKKIKGLDIIEI